MESYTNLNISRDAFIEWMLLVRFMLLQKWQYKLNGVGQTEIVVWKVEEKQTEQMIANRDKKMATKKWNKKHNHTHDGKRKGKSNAFNENPKYRKLIPSMECCLLMDYRRNIDCRCFFCCFALDFFLYVSR